MLTHSPNSRSSYISTHGHARPTPRVLTLFLSFALLISALILSGCAGVTSAKGNSVAAAADVSSSSQSTALTASPSAIEFGNVAVGAAMNQSLTISNSGTTALTVSQVTASGTGLTIGGVALPVTLDPGASATFTASFTPSSTGDVSGSISFVSQQLRQTLGVGWHGTGKAVAPRISAQPVSQSILVGQTATFSVTAKGTQPLTYQWNKNGAAITGATNSSYTTPAEVTSDNGAQFTVVVSDSAGNIVSTIATLSVTTSPITPSIAAQPASQSIFASQTATFQVVASGTSPFSYQWRKNGASISGATSATYTTPAETTADNGALFSVVISNSAGSVTSAGAMLTVNPDPVAPSVTSQPASQTILAGQTATFSVSVSGTAPLSYQWEKNGNPIGGATSASYSTPAETTSDNGALFSVVVSNSAGTATSNSAVLTVNAAPVAPSITSQPAGQTITAGQTATFSVSASGTAPLTYQWQKNGAAISGATSSSYTTPAEITSDSGAQFTVVVRNSAGSATSNGATLTVNPPTPGALTPSLTSLGFSSVIVGNNSTLGVKFTNSGTVNITVSSVTISGAGFTASGVSSGQIITPGQVVTLNVTFAPAVTGSVIGSVTIVSNSSNSPVSVGLSGLGALAHSAALSWTASTSTVIGYNVYRGTVSGGPYVLVNPSLITGTNYVDSTVVSGQTYFYVATAVAAGNVESVHSSQVTAAIPIP